MKNLLTTLTTFTKVNKANMHQPTTIKIYWEEEQETPDFDYGNAEDNAKEMKRFESGELVNVFIYVEATSDGRQGSDGLGQCFVRWSHFQDDILNIVAEHDMKNVACGELRDKLLSDAKLLSKYVEFTCQRHIDCKCTNHEKCNCTPF